VEELDRIQMQEMAELRARDESLSVRRQIADDEQAAVEYYHR